MTRKDFQLIADVLNDALTDAREDTRAGRWGGGAASSAINALALNFANELGDLNPRFDRDRFLKACLQRS